jgi:hypothetical protein
MTLSSKLGESLRYCHDFVYPDRFSSTGQTLEDGAAKADQTAAVRDLSNAVHQIGVEFAQSVAEKDKEIDSELQQATAAVGSAEEEFKAVLAKVCECLDC